MTIGEKIREYRDRKGLSQENVAEMLGMSLTGYANIEQNKSKVNMARLKQIAEALGTNELEILSIGERNIYYVKSYNQTGGLTLSTAYIINQNLPPEYLALRSDNEKLQIEMAYLKEKNQLLEDRLADLTQMIELMKK
jgi:transcriptional regulator with XRE-family HTH domain